MAENKGGNIILTSKFYKETGEDINWNSSGNTMLQGGRRINIVGDGGGVKLKKNDPIALAAQPLQVLKIEGPFDDKGKLVKYIRRGEYYLYKATPSRKLKPSEVLTLKWAFKSDAKALIEIPGVGVYNLLDNDKVVIKIRINNIEEKSKVYAYFKNPTEQTSVLVYIKTITFPILVLQGSRRKGRNRANNGTALDMLYNDYTEDAAGFEKLRLELYNETFNVEKQDSWHNMSSRADNAKSKSDSRMEKVKEFCKKSNDDLFKIFRNDIKGFAQGEVETVALEMVDKVKANTGGEYSNTKLTNAVINHDNSKTFLKAVKKIISDYVKANKGEIANLEITDDSKGILYDKLVAAKVDSPKFGDWFSGLGITINDVWAYQVYITDYKVNGNNFEMKLEYIYFDHFGLDYPDIEKFDKDIFYSWFVVQHFKNFKPFITKIEIVGELKGTF